MHKICKKCGTSHNKKTCPTCRAEYQKKYRRKNAQKTKEHAKKNKAIYREKHKEAIAVANRESQKKFRESNKDKINLWAKRYYLKIKDTIEYKNKRKSIGENRRAREKNAKGKLSKNIFIRLLNLQKKRCISCNVKITSKNAQLDHIYPLSKGGNNEDSNIQLLCVSCNRSKGAKHPIDFMQSRGFLL